ncbi:MAG: LOG family protein [Planctomycetota bacterium]|jgi:uncharacterized protein (TIGR00730 family)
MAVITVFCSSSPRTPVRYLAEAAACGRLLAEAGHEVVTGAGNSGCMGAVIDACLAAGGRARGVILRKFLDEGLHHGELVEMAVTETMRERKRLLGEEVDGYIVLPGGPGTWEEFWEVAVERQIDSHRRPVVVANVMGYYQGFLDQARRAAEEGFLYGPISDLFTVTGSAAEAVAIMTAELTAAGR